MPHKYKRFRCITSEMREKVKKNSEILHCYFGIYIFWFVCVCVFLSFYLLWFVVVCFSDLSFFSYFFLFFSFRWVCITTSLWLHRMDDSNLVYKDGNINASRTRSTQTRTVITTVSSFFLFFLFRRHFWTDQMDDAERIWGWTEWMKCEGEKWKRAPSRRSDRERERLEAKAKAEREQGKMKGKINF